MAGMILFAAWGLLTIQGSFVSPRAHARRMCGTRSSSVRRVEARCSGVDGAGKGGDDEGGDDGSGDGVPLDMGLLSQRIKRLRSSLDVCEANELPILVLDSMLPRQRLAISMDDEAGLKLVRDCIEMHCGCLGVHGFDPHTKSVNPAGTQVRIVERSGSMVELVGERRYTLCARPKLHANTYYTCELSWAQPDEGSPQDVAAAEELGPLVARWTELVRKGHEREPGQLDTLLADLGPMPSSGDPEERALWCAALINPLPALGVAFEIRPAMLKADSAELRLQIVRGALERSIAHLDGTRPIR